MNTHLQRTLRRSISFDGIGLHGGRATAMTLHPAPAHHGIVFRRTDLGTDDRSVTDIPARWDAVHDTTLCTALRNDAGTELGTVEHLMAALAGMEIDNALVEVGGAELPIMDGSSAVFVEAIEGAGLESQAAPRRVLEVLERVEVEIDGRTVAIEPADGFYIDCAIDFAHSMIAQQTYAFTVFNGNFAHEIGRARTFGFVDQVDHLRRMGLAQGGSLDNAIVLDRDGMLNEEPLRFDDEFVRHKVLDALGDLYLAGGPIRGRFVGQASGHALHNALLRALFARPAAFRWVRGAGTVGQGAAAGERIAAR